MLPADRVPVRAPHSPKHPTARITAYCAPAFVFPALPTVGNAFAKFLSGRSPMLRPFALAAEPMLLVSAARSPSGSAPILPPDVRPTDPWLRAELAYSGAALQRTVHYHRQDAESDEPTAVPPRDQRLRGCSVHAVPPESCKTW